VHVIGNLINRLVELERSGSRFAFESAIIEVITAD